MGFNIVNWEWQAAWVWDSGAEWVWDQYQGGAAYTHAHGYRALATARTAASPGNSRCSIIGSEVQVFHQPTRSLLFSFFYCPLSMSQCDRVRELVTVKFMFRVWMMVEGPPFHHFTQGQGMKMQLRIRYPELGWSCHVISSRTVA